MTMMDIAQAEAEKYEQLWSEVAEYRDYSPGLENFSRFVGVLKPPIHASLIDLGCGTGEAGLAFREIGLDVSWLDITDAGLHAGVPRHRFVHMPLAANLDAGGGCGVYVRGERGSLPPRASDMLAVRIRN